MATPANNRLRHSFVPIPGRRVVTSTGRRMCEGGILFVCLFLVFRALAIEPFGVPTGSMAPVLAGNHKAGACPRCGYPVMVGNGEEPRSRKTAGRYYTLATCPNCGSGNLGLETVPVCAGDRLLVNKTVFEFRKPRRWEMAVFRCPCNSDKTYVKRIVGLPGETVQIRGGDVFINGAIARKGLAECKAVRIPVFDNNYPPQPDGWKARWSRRAGIGGREQPADSEIQGTYLHLRAADDGEEHWLVYRHWLIDEESEQPLDDAYAYNGGDYPQRLEAVHDFMLECDIEPVQGEGEVMFGITDGLDQVVAEIPVGAMMKGARLMAGNGLLRVAPDFHLEPGKTVHVELAFMDRRALLAIDGRCVFEPADLPAADWRPEVSRPVQVGARGVEAVVANFRLFRDIHYTAGGVQSHPAPVRLGRGEYFVLGDNSSNSDDSRFWPDPVLPENNILGKPFLVHMPSRIVSWEVGGRRWEFQRPDWGRIRWLR